MPLISGTPIPMLVNHAQPLTSMMLIKVDAYALLQLHISMETINVLLAMLQDFGIQTPKVVLLALQQQSMMLIKDNVFVLLLHHIFLQIINVLLVMLQIIGLLEAEPVFHAMPLISGTQIPMLVNHAQPLTSMMLIKVDAYALLQLHILMETINVLLAMLQVYGIPTDSNALLAHQV
jgi:hypothetical protein